jgi:hypothetical protein
VIFLPYTFTFTLDLASTHYPIQSIPWSLSMEVKWAGYETDHSPNSDIQVHGNKSPFPVTGV